MNNFSTTQSEFLEESLLINALYSNQIIKRADVSDILGGIAGYIKDWAKENIDISSPSAAIASLAKIMVPSVLFRIHPALGIIHLIAKQFGFDLTDVVSGIFKSIAPKIEQGIGIVADDVNQAGKSLVSSAALTFFEELRKEALSYRGGYGRSETPSVPFLFPKEDSGIIGKIFGNLFETKQTGKAKWLLTGFVVWIIKTLLSGAGLLMLSGAVGGLFGKDKSKEITAPQTDSKPSIISEEKSTISTPKITLQSSGDGEQYHQNDGQSIWVVPLIDDNIKKTLVSWATNVYPSLSGQEEKVLASSKFQSLVRQLQQTQKNDKLVIPKQFHTRKQIVDQFIGDLGV